MERRKPLFPYKPQAVKAPWGPDYVGEPHFDAADPRVREWAVNAGDEVAFDDEASGGRVTSTADEIIVSWG